ncbi:MAG: M1 family aminopeptidase, partial [Acidimicrobiales bacterium]
HELAHMWFGDLVTMRWWEGIWLNEAFATFMETSCSHAYRPDWKVWTSFGRARAAAYATDALASTRPIEYPVHSPDDAEDMFDVLTYEKGASVVRMLEQHLGPETFRDGVRLYLRRHAHANTDTADLWDAIEEVSGEPVRRMMDGWINQGGHPVITAEPGGDGVTIGQHHFTLDPAAADGRTWVVPVGLGVREGSEHRESRVLLETRTQTVEGAVDEVVSATLGAAGFYRVMPAAATIDSVASDGPGRMTVDERHALLDDAWALTVAGRLAASDLLRLISGFAGESDLTVWHAIVGGLTGVRHITRETSVPHLARRVLAVSDGAARGLGHDTRPGDDDRTRELRATLLRLRGIVAEAPDEIAAARDLLQHPDPTLASAALTVVARHGDAEDFARFRRVFEEATDPQTEQRHLKVLADFPDPELVLTILTGTLDGTVRSQDGPYLLRRALINPEAGATAWAFIADNWDELVARFPSNSVARMLEGIAALDEPQLAASIDDFLERHRLPHGTKQIAQHRERLAVNTVFRQRESARLSRWLAAHD